MVKKMTTRRADSPKTRLVLFTRSMCSGCHEVKEFIWQRRRDIYHQVMRYNTSYLDGLTELAYRGLMKDGLAFPVLVEEWDDDEIKDVMYDIEDIKEKIANWPIVEGEFIQSWAPI